MLASFAEHWRGAPQNDGLRLKVVPDEMMRALEVRHGSMDVVVNDVSPDIYYQMQRDPLVHTSTGEGVDCQYIGVNLRDPILSDRRVRQAMAHAIDQQALVDHLRRGLARRANGLLPPRSWAHASEVRPYDHDPSRAQVLLDAAGYPDPDGPGPLPRFRLSLKVSNLEFNRLQSAVLQEQLRAVGIAVDVRAYEFATLFADVVAGNFQLFTLQWTAVSLGDPDILRRVFHSSQAPPGGFNRGHYSNPELDDRLDRAGAAREESERRALYADAQRILAEDLPYIPLWFKTNFALVRYDVTGVALNPFADLVFLRHVSRNGSSARP
jgi:peptide/nickel transport system substrate-binding protein